MKHIRKITIIANYRKKKALETGSSLVNEFRSKGIDVSMPDLTGYFDKPEEDEGYKVIASSSREANALIILGGDGTLLTTVRAIAQYEIPILPINVSGMGFLSEIDYTEKERALEALIKGDYTLERRMLLNVEVGHWKSIYLNELVIHRGLSTQVAHITINREGKVPITFSGDGLVVSTPTGSTAYSLSAGGPVIDPSLDLVLYTPICPHPQFIAPFILPTYEKVKITGKIAGGTNVTITVDGQVTRDITKNDEINISKSKYNLSLIRIKEWELFRVLRERWNWRDMREDKATEE